MITVIFAARSPLKMLAVAAYLIVGTVTYMIMMFLMNRGGAWEGAFFGIVASHFVVDAKVWRLRESFQRKLVGSRLGFLMAEPALAYRPVIATNS